MSAVKVVLLLCKDSEIQRFLEEKSDQPIPRAYCGIDNDDWNRMKAKAAEKIGNILPRPLRTLVVEMLRPLQRELQSWIGGHYFFFDTVRNYSFSIISWRSEGTIDRTETAKNFIRDIRFPPLIRFLLACIYFQENEIATLSDEARCILSPDEGNIIPRFWLRWLEEKSDMPWRRLVNRQLGNLYRQEEFRFPFRLSCFFQALSPENRQNYLAFYKWPRSHVDDMRLCLYQMNDIERVLFYQKNYMDLLFSLLQWPFHTLFMPAVNQLWGYLKPDDFYPILLDIINTYILNDLHYFDFLGILKEFWSASPGSFKEYIRKNSLYSVIELLLNFNGEISPTFLQKVTKMHRSIFLQLLNF